MRKKDLTHIGDCWQRFCEKNPLEPDDMALRIFFKECVGPKLSKYAQIVKISGGTVHVMADSSVVKNEIMLMRRKIIKAMNEYSGPKCETGGGKMKEIKNIVVVRG